MKRGLPKFQVVSTKNINWQSKIPSETEMHIEDRRRKDLVFEHMKKGSFAGVVESKEQDLGLLLPQPKRC